MWQNKHDHLYLKLEFKDFKQAFKFMGLVADAAESIGHHPRWMNEYNVVEFWLSTHDANDTVTPKDHELAGQIEKIYKDFAGVKEPIEQAPSTLKEVKMYSDGGSRGNPGPSAGGFVILDMENNVVTKNGKYLGITTNNQAEYHSLKGGLEEAQRMGVRVVHVFMDSLLVINQMKGIYKIKNRDLWPIYQAIKNIEGSFEKINFTHVPRELNKLADAVVNETLDATKN